MASHIDMRIPRACLIATLGGTGCGLVWCLQPPRTPLVVETQVERTLPVERDAAPAVDRPRTAHSGTPAALPPAPEAGQHLREDGPRVPRVLITSVTPSWAAIANAGRAAPLLDRSLPDATATTPSNIQPIVYQSTDSGYAPEPHPTRGARGPARLTGQIEPILSRR